MASAATQLRDKDFVRDLETVVYGCHTASQTKIRDLFDDIGLHTYFFAEYFLDEPVTVHTVREAKDRCAYFPFLARAAEELKFRIIWKASTKRLTDTDPRKHDDTVFHSKTSRWLQSIRSIARIPLEFAIWDSQVKRIARWFETRGDDFSDPSDPKEDRGLSTFKCRKEIERKATDVTRTLKASYEIQLHLWTKGQVSVGRPVYILRSPIASNHTYYGHFAVTFQLEDQLMPQRRLARDAFVCKLRNALAELSEHRYVPTLAILHMSKWEKGLRTRLKELLKVTPTVANAPNLSEVVSPRAVTTPVSLKWSNSTHPFEAAFGGLWLARIKHLDTEYPKAAPDGREIINEIVRGIILDKYLIASPSMVRQLREVIRGAKLMTPPKDQGDSLPSALIYGEAGSGKDKMARLIPTLTPNYLTAPITTQNMAALKPAMLTVPLMFGVTLGNPREIPGIFARAVKASGKPKLFASDSTRPDPHVFILDELNSLDYDMQGSLLRVLEDSEVAPLFATEDPYLIDALIVGIVNEDPEEVTRENELTLLKKAEDFLGKAEAARLYTALHGARRLRPDLVYRLKRGIYVKMPPLRDRREDIPLLFRKPCADFIRDLVNGSRKRPLKDIKVEFELAAFDTLMRPELPWPGNLRQLQAVARQVADVAYEDTLRTNKRAEFTADKEIEVRRAHVNKVLKNAFPVELGADTIS